MINFDRTTVKAPNIKKSYRIPSVYDALEIVFYNKCYLCETQKGNPRNFQIEHLKAHKKDEKLKYSWSNLYLACGDTCNQYKGDLEPLDPCESSEDVELLLIHKLIPFDYIPKFYPVDPENQKIVNTCQLLDKIHNGKDAHSKRKTAALREAIKTRASELKSAIIDYYKHGKESNKAGEYEDFDKIKQICSRKAPYTMLMRAVAKDNMSNKDVSNLFD